MTSTTHSPPSPLRELREGRGAGPAYYNEHDPYAAQWLRNLMEAGHIAPGYVDERSIVDVRPADLAGFAQCHFFAGIGGWSYAARLAGWPDDRPLWTGSCPCQPFSVAGAGFGQADERHLWPEFFRLIRACRPSVVMGEQVAAAVGKDWLDGVQSDLEAIDYACGAAVVPACAVDAPHRRDRLWFVANTDQSGQSEGREQRGGQQRGAGCDTSARDIDDAIDEWLITGNRTRLDSIVSDSRLCCDAARYDRGECDPTCRFLVADANSQRRQVNQNAGGRENGSCAGQEPRSGGACHGAVADSNSKPIERRPGELPSPQGARGRGSNHGPWGACEWLQGADGKARRVEPGIRLLAHGVPARVGKLRAYGNAIVPQVAAEVIGAYLDQERAAA